MFDQVTVLYVEDDPFSREVMTMIAETVMGVKHITLFDDSQNFISRLEALNPQPSIILLDIHIKPLNGFEMLDLIRQSPTLKHLPVLALTASVMNEEVHQLRTAGFNGVIGKPVNLQTFPSYIAKALQGGAVWQME